jgi:hypothetical protein
MVFHDTAQETTSRSMGINQRLALSARVAKQPTLGRTLALLVTLDKLTLQQTEGAQMENTSRNT